MVSEISPVQDLGEYNEQAQEDRRQRQSIWICSGSEIHNHNGYVGDYSYPQNHPEQAPLA